MRIRFLFICLVAAFSLGTSFAGNSKKEVSEMTSEAALQAEFAKIKLPILFPNGELSDLSYANNTLRIVLSIYGDDSSTLKKMSEAGSDLAKNLATQLTVMSDELKDLGPKLGVVIVYCLKEHPEEKVVVEISPEEMEDVKAISEKDKRENARDFLKKEAEKVNAFAPQHLDEFSVMTGCSIKKKSFAYDYSIIENDDFSVEQLKNQSGFREYLELGLLSQGVAVVSLFKNIVAAGYTLSYHYKGSKTKKSFSIVFTADELVDFVKKIEAEYVGE